METTHGSIDELMHKQMCYVHIVDIIQNKPCHLQKYG